MAYFIRTKRVAVMNRFKVYDTPHKGLRNAIAQFEMLAGSADYSSALEIERLYMLGREVFGLLAIHAEDEDRVTLAELATRCPGCSDHDMEDHRRLESEQRILEELLGHVFSKSKKGELVLDMGSHLYFGVSKFHGTYLLHIAEEETVTQCLLWEHFTDEELAEHHDRIMQRNPPTTLLAWFKFVLPAQNQQERIGLFTAFRKRAPETLFRQAMAVARGVLATEQYTDLATSLGIAG